MKKMTENEFHTKVTDAMSDNPRWRYGQAVFNVMYDLFPERANKYRGSHIDPFYKDNVAAEFINACWKVVRL